MTYGWHQTAAEISNSVFVRRTNKSKQGIIKAKKQLQEMGILVVLGKGGGSKTSEYMLDLWYDNPDRSVKASIIRQEEQLQDMQIAEEAVPELTEPDTPQEGLQISVSGEAMNADSDSSHVEEGGKLSLPPYKEDLSNSTLGEKEKQTVDTEAKEANPEKKKAAATVRYRFLSLFPEAQAEDDWQFFGWLAREYGLEACLGKLDYMKEHRKRHGITNPKGFFRTALARDFQPPAFIMAKLKADERAKREIERCQRESEEWRKMTASFNYELATASLQKLLDSLN
jgi:hypothetical protein